MQLLSLNLLMQWILLQPKKESATTATWVKANGVLGDNMRVHRYLLAAVSDFNFFNHSSKTPWYFLLDPRLRLATVDHAMWLHRSFSMDEWLLYVVENTSTSEGKAFVQGKFFREDGKLAAQTTQEVFFESQN